MADRRHQALALAWLLKEKILPPIYWKAMLRGKEWMVQISARRDPANAAGTPWQRTLATATA
jgi:hypothetical protein